MMQSLPVLNLLQDTGRGCGQEALLSLPHRVGADHTTTAAQARPENSAASGHCCRELAARWVGWPRVQGRRRRRRPGEASENGMTSTLEVISLQDTLVTFRVSLWRALPFTQAGRLS